MACGCKQKEQDNKPKNPGGDGQPECFGNEISNDSQTRNHACGSHWHNGWRIAEGHDDFEWITPFERGNQRFDFLLLTF
jgi:hypothetical protein